jgi:hypothetical protein
MHYHVFVKDLFEEDCLYRFEIEHDELRILKETLQRYDFAELPNALEQRYLQLGRAILLRFLQDDGEIMSEMRAKAAQYFTKYALDRRVRVFTIAQLHQMMKLNSLLTYRNFFYRYYCEGHVSLFCDDCRTQWRDRTPSPQR